MVKNEKAFPQQGQQTGMDLRDWFAGMALQGMMAHPTDGYAGDDYDYPAELSKAAFEYADAMLAEREKNDENSI